MSQPLSELEKAVRYALRRKRGRVGIICAAISQAGWEGNMCGRLEPAAGGQSPEQRDETERKFEAAAIRTLRI